MMTVFSRFRCVNEYARMFVKCYSRGLKQILFFCGENLTNRFSPPDFSICRPDFYCRFDFSGLSLRTEILKKGVVMSVASPSLKQSPKSGENRLLSRLPQQEKSALIAHLQPIHLKKKTVLYHAGDAVRYCYFPLNGMLSVLSSAGAGEIIEVSMIGNEGMAGVPAILQSSIIPYEVMVQIPSDAMRIEAEALKKQFNQGGTLQWLLLKYVHALLCQISQSGVCNRFHTTEQRLSRWLLISRDRVQTDTFQLTQEFISHMLGVPRTLVTMTAGALQEKGLISYRRGQITIIEREGLEAAACECYRIINREIDNLYR